MSEKVLLVDDEPLVLEGYRRVLRKEFDVTLAVGGEKGLAELQQSGPFAVVLSDLRMPGMDGNEFLSRVGQIAPNTIRMMLTGNADVDAFIHAVNQGKIFRFLAKPTTAEDLTLALRACIEQYRLVLSEKELLEKTLFGAVQVLTEVLSLVNPVAFGKSNRVRNYVSHIARRLSVTHSWEFEVAAMLCQLGCVTLTPETMESVHMGQVLSPEEQHRYNSHPVVARDLLTRIPRLGPVAEMISRQNEAASAAAGTNAKSPARLGAQALKIGLAFDQLLSQGVGHHEAIDQLLKNPSEYDRAIVSLLSDLHIAASTMELHQVKLADLRIGMVLDEDLRSSYGLLLVGKGQEVTAALVARIRSFLAKGTLSGEVRALVPTACAEKQTAANAGAD
ncbi:MAG TPA: HD domain-containing phosphohydrolase [Terriglobales bacterium]|nr:HD domain-containing phosphohydrolase [Terriglobales bacterium]